jgi:flagellar export protein FliJ
MPVFRLATLLRLRERERDSAAQEVRDAKMAIERVEQAKRELTEQNEEMNSLRKQASHGAINLRQLLDAQRFQMILNAQVQQLDQNLNELSAELGRREAVLLRCQQNVKSLEKLKEQRAEAAATLALAKQQERTDEWSSVRYASDIQSSEGDDSPF